MHACKVQYDDPSIVLIRSKRMILYRGIYWLRMSSTKKCDIIRKLHVNSEVSYLHKTHLNSVKDLNWISVIQLITLL